MTDRKLLACCTVCDEPCFVLMGKHTEGLFKGEMRDAGPPLQGSRRAIMLRMSGNTSWWTLCGTCEITPDMLPALNKKEVRAMVKERKITLDPRLSANMIRLFHYDVPIAMLTSRSWHGTH